MELEKRIDKLILALMANYKKFSTSSNSPQIRFECRPGKVYIRIMMLYVESGTGSVHAFVHKENGSLLKPASLKQPAKGERYWLLDEQSFQQCLQNADWAGSYLYKR